MEENERNGTDERKRKKNTKQQPNQYGLIDPNENSIMK